MSYSISAAAVQYIKKKERAKARSKSSDMFVDTLDAEELLLKLFEDDDLRRDGLLHKR